MNQIKSLTIVVLILVALLILVIVRSSDKNLFKKEVRTAIEATQNNSNTISLDQLKKQTRSWIVVNLGSEDLPDFLHSENSIHLPVENILDQTNRKILGEAKGDLILYSNDEAMAAKTWVILNQLGFENVFILNTGSNPEVLKYKFQPDTTARLEQDSM
ncbi:MAG: rhodanese-like domain-containing protein [Bacteroidota bacterium]|nr:rhodanese-like domain-containing protein [Bacteroidota bacterium]